MVNNYDVLARLSSVTRAGVQLAGYQYNRNSQDSLSSLMPNMPTTKYLYNTRNWITLLQSSNSGNTFFREGLYYNPNGNIYSQYMDGNYNDNFSNTENLYYHYTYDKSNRLTKSDADLRTDTENMYDLLMSYDPDGNFQSMTRTGSDKDHTDLFVYEYAAGTNKLMQIRGANEYDYDQNGNLSRDDINHTWAMQYDFRNLLISFKSIRHVSDKPEDPDHIIYTEYAYDEAGNRISKKVWKYTGEDPDPVIELESPGTWVQLTNDFYLRNTSGAEVAVYNSTAIQFWNIWGIDNVGRINADTTKQFYLKDHLGSIRCALNSASTIISAQDFDAWGHEMEGRKYDAGSGNAKYLFTSKERDSESDYDYYGARYYDSRIGRWGGVDISQDKNPDWTPYRAFFDNPLKFIDPNGKYELPQWVIDKYPKFSKFIENISERVQKNHRIMYALMRNTGLSEKIINDNLVFGQGPLIKVEKLKYTYGETHEPWKNEFKIDETTIQEFENSSGTQKEIYEQFMEAIIFHESTHLGYYWGHFYGWIDDKILSDPERGRSFEIDAYGMVFWDKDYAAHYLDYVNKKNGNYKTHYYEPDK
ncbi:hypothetical protein BH10BAC5_BH10BAC5_24970 [soil metagenome]